MLDQLQAPLLAVLQTSPDFQPALDSLLSLANAVRQQNPERSRALLTALRKTYPHNPTISLALAQLP
jgi:TolA-binding protein